jgi:hypothetical protein
VELLGIVPPTVQKDGRCLMGDLDSSGIVSGGELTPSCGRLVPAVGIEDIGVGSSSAMVDCLWRCVESTSDLQA